MKLMSLNNFLMFNLKSEFALLILRLETMSDIFENKIIQNTRLFDTKSKHINQRIFLC